MTELSDCTDTVLDSALEMFYRQHEAAMAAGDSEARAETHWAIRQILDEFSRRLDAWIADHMEVNA